jgi:hypothetical protein
MTKTPAGNIGLNARHAEVLNLALVLLFGFGAKLNFCAFNPALRQAPKRYQQLNNYDVQNNFRFAFTFSFSDIL